MLARWVSALSVVVVAGALSTSAQGASPQPLRSSAAGLMAAAVAATPTPDPRIATFRAKRLSIAAKLSPSVLAKVLAVAHGPTAQPAALGPGAASVFAAIDAAFPGITPPQADLLTFVAVEAALDAELDSMNDMSEMTQMKLQMAMDRRSKFVEALSNIMKKIDSTQETIVQNMKG